MSQHPINARRADDAAESVGLTPTSINSGSTGVQLQNDPDNRWTIDQGKAVATAFGAPADQIRIQYFPPTEHCPGFCSVHGAAADGLRITIFCAYEPEVTA